MVAIMIRPNVTICLVQGRIHVWSESAPAPLLTDKSCKFSLGYFWGVISATRPPLLDLGPPFYISWIRPWFSEWYRQLNRKVTLLQNYFGIQLWGLCTGKPTSIIILSRVHACWGHSWASSISELGVFR